LGLGLGSACPIDVTAFQSIVLGFVGQEAIAHGAIIFATLAAAFTFATGFKITARTHTRGRVSLYVVLLTILLSGAIYAFLRMFYYGQLSTATLTLCPQPGDMSDPSLKEYWRFVSTHARENPWVAWLGAGLTVPSLLVSWVLGFLSAVSVTSYLGEEHEKFANTFHRLPALFKLSFVWAFWDYWAQVVLSQPSLHLGDYATMVAVPVSLLPAALFYWRRAWMGRQCLDPVAKVLKRDEFLPERRKRPKPEKET
jgi:hypothetical protein